MVTSTKTVVIALALQVWIRSGTVHAGVGEAVISADFNGDGYEDLAVGHPEAAGGGIHRAGAVHILYGSSSGLVPQNQQYWHQDSQGILNESEGNDKFGASLEAADFNGDGYADLVVGVPSEDFGKLENGGAVHILYGSSSGLTGQNSQFWHQNSPGVRDNVEKKERFGKAIAVGDFNGDGRADLAIGVVQEDFGKARLGAGVVHVLYGGMHGLTAARSQYWNQDSAGILDAAGSADFFGWALAAGDFNGDDRADLAIGVEGEDVGGVLFAGAVQVLYGSRRGLTAFRNQLWHQNSPGIREKAELQDGFGTALAAADFNDNGRDDLVVGIAGEDIGSRVFAGAVQVLYGSRRGLTALRNQLWHQNSRRVPEKAEANDRFGDSLAAGDFNGDGRADLAIGAPFEGAAGVVHILYGKAPQLSANNTQLWHENVPDLADQSDGGLFGFSLATGDFNGDGRADLVVGVPFKHFVGVPINVLGAARVIYGASGGLSSLNSQLWKLFGEELAIVRLVRQTSEYLVVFD